MQFDIIQHSAHVVGKCVIAYGAEGKAHGGKMVDTIIWQQNCIRKPYAVLSRAINEEDEVQEFSLLMTL